MPSDDDLLAAWLADPDAPAPRAALAAACAADPALAQRARSLLVLDRLLALRLGGADAALFRDRLDTRMRTLADGDFRRGVLLALPPPRARRRWLAAGLAAAGLAAAVALWLASAGRDAPVALVADAAARELPLPEGGRLVLQPGSAWLPGADGGRLQAGVADLTIEPRAHAPFRASLGEVDVTVLGTVFRLRHPGDVLLQRGRLAVARGGERWELDAGEALAFGAGGVPRRGSLLLDGWSPGQGPATMAVSRVPPATLLLQAPADGGESWALAEHPLAGLGTVTMLVSGRGAPGTAWGLIAIEADGDAWLIGGDSLAAVETTAQRGWWPGNPAHKRLAANGDGVFAPATVVRLAISLSGGAAELTVQEAVAWR